MGGMKAAVTLYYGEKKANADSILELMALEAGAGCIIEIRAEGSAEEEAAAEVARILQSY